MSELPPQGPQFKDSEGQEMPYDVDAEFDRDQWLRQDDGDQPEPKVVRRDWRRLGGDKS
jgi:hypothetical protein